MNDFNNRWDGVVDSGEDKAENFTEKMKDKKKKSGKLNMMSTRLKQN